MSARFACPLCGTWVCKECGWKRTPASRLYDLHSCKECGSENGEMLDVRHHAGRGAECAQEYQQLIERGVKVAYPVEGFPTEPKPPEDPLSPVEVIASVLDEHPRVIGVTRAMCGGRKCSWGVTVDYLAGESAQWLFSRHQAEELLKVGALPWYALTPGDAESANRVVEHRDQPEQDWAGVLEDDAPTEPAVDLEVGDNAPTEVDTCRIVEVDGEQVRYHGQDMTDEDQEAFAEVVRAAKRRFDDEQTLGLTGEQVARNWTASAKALKDAMTQDEPEDGHTFRITVDSRGSHRIQGEQEYRDEEDFSGMPFMLEVRAWSLQEAVRKASEVALPSWSWPAEDDAEGEQHA